MVDPEILTLLTAAAPISELRGAIPLGMSLGLTPAAVYFWAVLGNMLPILPLLLFLKYGSRWAMAHLPIIKRILNWVFARTRAKHGQKFEQIGFWALLVFVAIPLPLTGGWTGVVIAYLIDMPIKKAFFAILGGVLLAGLAVLALTFGLIKLF